jgi:hypothetical protein
VTLLSSAPGGIVIAEYSGIATTTPLDKTVTSKPSAFASTITSGTTAATTQANELVIALFGSIRTSHPTNTFGSYTNSFVEVGQVAATTGDADMVAMVEKIVSTTGTQTSTATLAGGAEQRPVGSVMTFKATAGATTAPTFPRLFPRALLIR